jgi:hypothetical protein
MKNLEHIVARIVCVQSMSPNSIVLMRYVSRRTDAIDRAGSSLSLFSRYRHSSGDIAQVSILKSAPQISGKRLLVDKKQHFVMRGRV